MLCGCTDPFEFGYKGELLLCVYKCILQLFDTNVLLQMSKMIDTFVSGYIIHVFWYERKTGRTDGTVESESDTVRKCNRGSACHPSTYSERT